ncbi:p-type ATPase superfamily [Micromonas pusilla CCMP1545]|uniref:P-type ATPase superfamily n=1 Tax=Micromonas pusilla (strain CCMP1545) TaxID=564608 RepID=C1MZH9_MICPC|nr:p-type ATPase superfamily [Micromonas pusilla CCMP1545]EEH54606.1 p-type ATPase superfamily [Micromonas pusilla CCMP1545]|eukprot:XP_003060956.1 p-type ATPase superfamily [Micromonas pusilla CCMP1545]
MNYRETDAIKDGSYLMFVPMPHQGKAEIVRVNALEIPDADAPGGVREMLWTTFQRQRFEFVETERGGGANGKARGEVREVLTPVANALSSYVRPTRGLTPAAVAAYVSRYGDNSLRVPLPTFMQVYKEQLMGPVTVFQVFTVLLWLMDEYWKYAIFSAASLLLFEGTTAFSKIKNIRTLRGMGQAPGRVNCLRDGRWEDRNTEDLVPGDIVSIVRVAGGAESPIPCDCLVLRGSTVVNEASLTGESVPQMKDALSPEAIASDPSKPLDIDGEHKVNVLYSGTTLMQQSTGEQPTGGVAANLPKTPDGGCLCYVLQTGFSSTQGKLMRMMEFSSEQVTGDTWETLVLLFILLVFACVASGHVFVVGLRDGKRSQYELVLRCILILTSVVPPELPMQTAMAVNTALLALMKAAVFCTEPFRVPISGKVDTCLFDKTGTLTSDQLVAVGVVTPVSGAGAGGEDGEYSELTPCAEASKAASLVVAGCHSLVQVDGKTFGDPLEQAALRGVKWRFDPRSQTAPPTRSWTGRPMVKILVRNHFSSALQRMSAVANVVQNSNDAPAAWVLMKGSPEIVATLLTKKPAGYDRAYRKLAEQGYRIIALAHRVLSTDEAHRVKDPRCPLTRDEMERGLTFDGFLAFACPVRTDTPDVVKALKASSHTVMMATGDSAMTALHVANEVHIASGGLERALTLVASGGGGGGDDGDGAAPTLRWVSAKTDDATNEPIREIPYAADGSIPALAKDYCLCVTGAALNAAAGVGRGNGGLWDYLDSVVVFARMSPDDKERVLKRLKQQGRHTFMCGDGANDVGALKQAHVGVALLSGFGSANTKKVDAAGADAGAVATTNKSEVPTEAKAETFSEKMKRDMETPKVKLGDASMAAPFTSRIPSVRSAVDIIRQGRCTLVSAIQMQQVLVLSCLISAYSLSVLYLDGIRSSDNQMIASGSALTAASLAFSYATPVHTLSPVRPLRSIFHPANFLSLIGQLVIHIGCMVYAVEMNAPIAIVSDALKANATEEQRSIWEQGPPFKPSLLNTVVFLVETVQRVCVMLVNYKGRPFMMGAIENKTLLTSLASMVAGAFICAFEVLPWLNTWLKLVPLPSFDFRVRILAVLGVSVGGTIAWDQLMLLCFAPQILFAAYRDTYRALPAPRDLVKPGKRAIAMGVAGYLYFTTGNVFVLLGLFYAMKNKVI